MPSETAAIAELTHPSHSCLIYSTPEEQCTVTCEYIARGLMRGERCIFLESPEKIQQIREALAEKGVDVAAEEARGALILSSSHDYLKEGRFDADRMLAFLKQTVDEALEQGFSAVRATGDLNWE